MELDEGWTGGTFGDEGHCLTGHPSSSGSPRAAGVGRLHQVLCDQGQRGRHGLRGRWEVLS